MTNQIVFYFCGTGTYLDEYQTIYNFFKSSFKENTLFICVAGAHEPRIGGSSLFPTVGNVHGSGLFPNLEVGAKHIRQAFVGSVLHLNQLKQDLGNAVLINWHYSTNPTINVDRIALTGFSRGAISAFATAKYLNELHIPLDIIADQPVPGQMLACSPHNLYQQYKDLSAYHTIQHATVFLSLYHLHSSFIENIFFRQMVTVFSDTTATNHYLVPNASHFSLSYHVLFQLAQWGYCKEALKQPIKDIILEKYRRSTAIFIPPEYAQHIYGFEKCTPFIDPLYLDALEHSDSPTSSTQAITSGPQNQETMIALAALQEIRYTLPPFLDEYKKNLFLHVVYYAYTHAHYLFYLAKPPIHLEKRDRYLRDIYQATEHYLSNHSQDKAVFIKNITLAQNMLESTLEANRDNHHRCRRILRLITNTILHLTGLFILFNSLNYKLRGSYLFFNQAEETRVARHLKQGLLKQMVENHEVEDRLNPLDPS